ncbi:MAG: hypothetical protein P4L87_06750 [Formivibrio sp.]|nr:hypothetical protein [Formivibrio sp.]
MLKNSSRSNNRRTRADYLLSGILKSPNGTSWHSDGEGFYRAGKGKRVKATTIEAAVLGQRAENLQAEDFVAAFTAEAKAQTESRMRDTELPRLRKELASIDRQISRVTELPAQTATPAPLLRQIETYEQRRQALVEDVAQRAELEKEAQAIRNLTEKQVTRIMKGLAEDMASLC